MPRARSCASSSSAVQSATCSSWGAWTGSSSWPQSHPGSYADRTLADPLAPPGDLLEACVVLPIHDDDADLGPALRALAGQEGVPHGTYEVIVVLAGCRDELPAEAVAPSWLAQAQPAATARTHAEAAPSTLGREAELLEASLGRGGLLVRT